MSELLALNHYNFSSSKFQSNQNNTTSSQSRQPFADISSHIKLIENISNNFSKNSSKFFFNDNLPVESSYLFLRKKSHGIDFNQIEDSSCHKVKEKSVLKENKIPYEKEKKNSLFLFNNNGYNFTSNLNEEDEEANKENICKMNNIWSYSNNCNNNKKQGNDNNLFSFGEILKSSFEEKKNMDRIERDYKKALKNKQMKLTMMHSKNKSNIYGNVGFSTYNSNNNIFNDSNKQVMNYKINKNNNEGLDFTFGKNNDSNIIDMNVED